MLPSQRRRKGIEIRRCEPSFPYKYAAAGEVVGIEAASAEVAVREEQLLEETADKFFCYKRDKFSIIM